jgi:outer membrane receptor protein involved in Fe transport
MKKTLLFKFVVLVFAFVGVFLSSNAQVTTATMSGVIRETKGALPGASVRATHTPTGTVYTTTTSADGRYTIQNMRSGGPYTIEVTFIGYQPFKNEGIFLKLGDSFAFNANLNDGGNQLEEVVVAGKADKTFNSKRIGASTNISKEQLEKLPTISRSLQDFTRLTPQANGNSFAGTNNRFNSISIDGAVNNDVFGLAANGAPGGQAGTQPISLDAIQEIQVVLSPYDVSNGNFAGGGINAVTRSGTNRVEGSAYFLTRNEGITGKKVGDVNQKAGDFSNTTYGFRIGAPIIKNKLFIFVNAEKTKNTAPTTFNAGDALSVLSVADANTILSTLQTRYGYDGGAIGEISAETKSDKIFARIDWNINSKNQLTLRHNYIKASDDNISRSATSFRFGNNAYAINNTQNNSVLELRSQISETLSNNLIIGYSRIRDFREPSGQLFPQIRINGFAGGASAFVGSEASSTANSLDQDVFEFSDNFKIFAGKHTFTVGTHNEFFKFKNVFINNFAGSYAYNTLADFVGGTVRPVTATSNYSIVPGDSKPAAQFDAAQLGFYFQDEIEAFTGFKLTAGLRADVPMIFDTPPANPLVPTAFPGNRTDQTPQRRILVSPRLGFNWDLTGTRSMQLRGGVALLTSRAPFVWLSNGFTNNGLLTGQVNATNSTGTFIPDPNNQQAAGGSVVNTYEVNLINKNLKLPQTWRSNIAMDVKLPGGILGTLEAIYSKTVNNIIYSNINLRPSVAAIPAALTGGADNRPLFNYSGNKVNSTFTNAFYLDNTNQGSSYNLTAELKKGFDFGLYSTIAYTYGKAKDVNSGTSSTASSNTNFVQTTTGPNNAPLAISNFDIRHRIVGSLNYSIYYGKQKASGTTLSLVYVGKSGTPFTYLYNGDLNNDGATGNDLLYVPRNQSEIRLSTVAASGTRPAISIAQQWADLDAFIESDPYLKNLRGQYTVRNGARMPWEHQFDFRILQDIGTIFKGSKNTLQLSFEIINIGNLINKDWGHLYSLGNNASTLVNYVTSSQTYTFVKPTTATAYQVSPFASRWQGQLGVRYIFN